MQNKPLPVGRGLCRMLGLGAFPLIRHGFAVPPSPTRGEADSPPLSGGDVERSETEGVGDLAAGQTDEGEAKELYYFTTEREIQRLFSAQYSPRHRESPFFS